MEERRIKKYGIDEYSDLRYREDLVNYVNNLNIKDLSISTKYDEEILDWNKFICYISIAKIDNKYEMYIGKYDRSRKRLNYIGGGVKLRSRIQEVGRKVFRRFTILHSNSNEIVRDLESKLVNKDWIESEGVLNLVEGGEGFIKESQKKGTLTSLLPESIILRSTNMVRNKLIRKIESNPYYGLIYNLLDRDLNTIFTGTLEDLVRSNILNSNSLSNKRRLIHLSLRRGGLITSKLDLGKVLIESDKIKYLNEKSIVKTITDIYEETISTKNIPYKTELITYKISFNERK